jgi:hypothetical protein
MKQLTLSFTLLALLFGGRGSILPLSPSRAAVSGRAPSGARSTITTTPTTIVKGQQDDVASGFCMASAASPFTVTATHPMGNGLIIARDGVISATFSRGVDGSTVSTRTFTVRGKQTGICTQTYSIDSNSISFDAQPNYLPGEEIVVNLSSGLRATDGVPLTPYAWQFRAAVMGGSGVFDSGQRPGNGQAVALGDVDGDGDLDAFVANGLVQATSKVWLNDGTGVFIDGGQSVYSPHGRAVALGDVDGDGDLDAFVAHTVNQANQVWLNDGAGTFTDSDQSLGNSQSHAVALGDVDGDGDLDAFVANNNGEANKVWLNVGMGAFSDSGQILGSLSSRAIALGDVDGDGDLDAFVANYSLGNGNRIWLNDSVSGEQDIIYLPLILHNYTPPVAFPVHIGDAIPVRGVAHQGEVFYTTAVRMPDALPSGGRFYFSSQRDAVAEVLVDDELSVLLDGVEVFTYRFSSAGTLPEPAVVEVPRTTMERLVGRTATVEYRDVYGVVVEASAVWLIWAP